MRITFPIDRRSLRFKWMALISAAVLVALLGSTMMLFATMQSSLQRAFADGNAVQVESATREMRMMIGQYEKSVEYVAEMIEISGADSETKETEDAIAELLRATATQDQSLLSVYFIPASTGKLLAHPLPERDRGDARASDLYKLALQTEDTAWTDVRWDEHAGRMTVSVVTPVRSGERWIGVAGYDIDLQGIGQLRESNEKFGKNKLVVYDNQGRIVTSFLQGMEGRNIDPGASGGPAAADVLPDASTMEETFAWVRDIADGQRTGLAFRWEGIDYRGEVSFVYAMNWTVVSFIDKHALYRDMLDFLRTSALALAGGLCIGALAAFYLAARLVKLIRQLRSVIAKTAEGDLTTEFDYGQQDEIGELAESYNGMLRSMRALIRQVHDSVAAVEESAGVVARISGANVVSGTEVARAAEEIAAGAADASAEAERSADAVRRLSGSVETLVEQSEAIERTLAAAGEQVRSGNDQVGHLERAYLQVDRAFGQVTELVEDLHRQSQTILSVTTAIADIAKQTNILSLNASIEAARAGEHGRGFAVVANEIRQLSEQTKASAQHIQRTISSILTQTDELVSVVGRTNEVNRTQKEAVALVSGSMRTMSESLDMIKRHIEDEVRTIETVEALRGTVVASIGTIASVSEQTTASTQEIASSVETQMNSLMEVSAQAEWLAAMVLALKEAVSKFRGVSPQGD
ncbi:methyl-accepting chemotaxis protein [Paenibacillus sp.]|uniref:methyl-accepting chemotaxis protein n=1 Tax=Paenibacillus sp. TaxID=58172 RepID=UPI002D2F1918|nr:methyl-accepting chemotaxis protein [Paenibacillus sp.]HZG84804.1 methyl-accepting chemotaxis protein [Paenibacillus sp.]